MFIFLLYALSSRYQHQIIYFYEKITFYINLCVYTGFY